MSSRTNRSSLESLKLSVPEGFSLNIPETVSLIGAQSRGINVQSQEIDSLTGDKHQSQEFIVQPQMEDSALENELSSEEAVDSSLAVSPEKCEEIVPDTVQTILKHIQESYVIIIEEYLEAFKKSLEALTSPEFELVRLLNETKIKLLAEADLSLELEPGSNGKAIISIDLNDNVNLSNVLMLAVQTKDILKIFDEKLSEIKRKIEELEGCKKINSERLEELNLIAEEDLNKDEFMEKEKKTRILENTSEKLEKQRARLVKITSLKDEFLSIEPSSENIEAFLEKMKVEGLITKLEIQTLLKNRSLLNIFAKKLQLEINQVLDNDDGVIYKMLPNDVFSSNIFEYFNVHSRRREYSILLFFIVMGIIANAGINEINEQLLSEIAAFEEKEKKEAKEKTEIIGSTEFSVSLVSEDRQRVDNLFRFGKGFIERFKILQNLNSDLQIDKVLIIENVSTIGVQLGDFYEDANGFSCSINFQIGINNDDLFLGIQRELLYFAYIANVENKPENKVFLKKFLHYYSTLLLVPNIENYLQFDYFKRFYNSSPAIRSLALNGLSNYYGYTDSIVFPDQNILSINSYVTYVQIIENLYFSSILDSERVQDLLIDLFLKREFNDGSNHLAMILAKHSETLYRDYIISLEKSLSESDEDEASYFSEVIWDQGEGSLMLNCFENNPSFSKNTARFIIEGQEIEVQVRLLDMGFEYCLENLHLIIVDKDGKKHRVLAYKKGATENVLYFDLNNCIVPKEDIVDVYYYLDVNGNGNLDDINNYTLVKKI
jgi:hypothetical protein